MRSRVLLTSACALSPISLGREIIGRIFPVLPVRLHQPANWHAFCLHSLYRRAYSAARAAAPIWESCAFGSGTALIYGSPL